jgi:ribosomal protein L11 methyltransferase
VQEQRVLRLGRDLVIGPPGTRREARPGDRVVELELYPNTPADGVVFGTGEHATTRLALGFLVEQLREGDCVLDVGTGSGVLALAAARLGAREVLALDIDPAAVVAAEANIRRNGLGATVRARMGSVAAATSQTYDLALANILSPVIREIALALRRLLRPGGGLIVSGIIGVEGEDVRRDLESCGFRCVEERAEGDWSAFLLQSEPG